MVQTRAAVQGSSRLVLRRRNLTQALARRVLGQQGQEVMQSKQDPITPAAGHQPASLRPAQQYLNQQSLNQQYLDLLGPRVRHLPQACWAHLGSLLPCWVHCLPSSLRPRQR